MKPTTSRRHVAALLLVASLIAVVMAVKPSRTAADTSITWQKVPAQAQITACDQTLPQCPSAPVDLGGGAWLNGLVLTEVMNNQSDPHGFGAYQLHVTYDPRLFRDAQITDLGTLNDGSVRTTACQSSTLVPGDTFIQCATTGPFGVGAMWIGPMPIATVSLVLQPTVFGNVGPAPNGGFTSIIDDNVRVTNTCGQPLNDGTSQPLPGQVDCQGQLLPGLGAAGTVLNPGSSTVVITRPPEPTATDTPTPSVTPPAPTATTTDTPTREADTRTPISATRTTIPTLTTSGTTIAANTPTSRPTQTATTAAPSSPGLPTRTPELDSATPAACPLEQPYWRNHAAAWQVDALSVGGHEYGRSHLIAILSEDDRNPANILARALIAAKLNMSKLLDSSMMQVINQGDALLATLGAPLPARVEPASYTGQGMVWTAVILDRFNNRCAPESAPPPVTSNTARQLPSTGIEGAFRDPRRFSAMVLAIIILVALVLRNIIRDLRDP